MAHAWFPLLYILLSLCGLSSLRLDWLAACTLGGWMVSYTYQAWQRRFSPPVAMQTSSSLGQPSPRLVQHLRQSGWAERIHWFLGVGLLGLTWWAMLGGLRLLFKPERWGVNFTLLFSLLIVGVLLWLLMMITLKRRYWRYVALYLLFDLFSAFSFNFVHFYENISYTQRMDASMKLCEGYADYQSPAIDALIAHTARSLGAIREAEREDERRQALQIRRKQGEIASNEHYISSLEQRLQDASTSELERQRLAQEYGQAKRRQALRIRQLDELGSAAPMARKDDQLQDSAEMYQLQAARVKLRQLSQRYAAAPKRFTPEQLDSAKGAVLTMQAILEQPHFNTTLRELGHRVRTDTISYSLWRLRKREQDHFASIGALMRVMGDYISPVDGYEVAALHPDEYQNSVWRRFRIEESAFEHRLLLLSIMLSILVDLLPLALAILVRQTKDEAL